MLLNCKSHHYRKGGAESSAYQPQLFASSLHDRSVLTYIHNIFHLDIQNREPSLLYDCRESRRDEKSPLKQPGRSIYSRSSSSPSYFTYSQPSLTNPTQQRKKLIQRTCSRLEPALP